MDETRYWTKLGYIVLQFGETGQIPIYGGADWVPGDRDRLACPALRNVARVRGFHRDNGAILGVLDTLREGTKERE